MKDFNKCVRNVETEENEWLKLSIKGNIPSEIKGRLLRMGPAKYDFEKSKTMNHWFDGFGHLYGFKFEGGNVYFKNRFLETYSYKKSIQKKKNVGLMFATNPSFSFANVWNFIKRLPLYLIPMLPSKAFPEWDNSNVNIIPNKDKNFLALGETTHYIEFDKCLNTLRNYNKKYNYISGQATTAHPEMDQENLYNVIIDLNLISQVKIVKQNKKTEKRKVLKRFFRFCPSYTHSFAQTEKHIILIEQPLKLLSPMLFVFSPLSFIDTYKWFSAKSKMTVIDKNSGKVLLQKKVDPFFFFHTTNSHIDEDVINIEVACYKDMEVLKTTMMDNLKTGKVRIPKPFYKNFKIDLANKTIQGETKGKVSLELQRINEKYKNKKHNFVYGIGSDDVNDQYIAFSNIVKYNIEKDKTLKFNDPDTYFGEPVFINKKDEKSEDDGYLLSMGINTKKEKSILFCLNAKTLKEEFRAECNKIVPHGFHGGFVKES